jgi:hypothetical protein
VKRLLHLLKNEFKLARTAIPIHLVAVLQPTVMYLLMSTILVHPTFDMDMVRPSNEGGRILFDAMKEVGSPIGFSYINPILVDENQSENFRQVISVEDSDGRTIAYQHFGLIDSNIVKNFRNRLTSAALLVWNDDLGKKGVTIQEHPRLPRDMPYTLYFGMAMLPLTSILAASIIGGTLAAQEFESGTILEYRLTPVSVWKVIGIQLIHLALTGLISTFVLMVAIWAVNDIWPHAFWKAILIICPLGIIAGSLGIIAGVIFQKSIPAFLVGLIFSFVSWLLGSSFGLAAGFSKAYENISRLIPNTHTVELLYPLYFNTKIGTPLFSVIFLTISSLVMVGLAVWVYHSRVKIQN